MGQHTIFYVETVTPVRRCGISGNSRPGSGSCIGDWRNAGLNLKFFKKFSQVSLAVSDLAMMIYIKCHFPKPFCGLMFGCQMMEMLYNSIGEPGRRGTDVKKVQLLIVIVLALPCWIGCATRTWQSMSITCKHQVVLTPQCCESFDVVRPNTDALSVPEEQEEYSGTVITTEEKTRPHSPYGMAVWILVITILASSVLCCGVHLISHKHRLASILKLVLLGIGVCFFIVYYLISSFPTQVFSLLGVHSKILPQLLLACTIFLALLRLLSL
jgi:hypothetical protein